MALLALPLIVAATREALEQVPNRVREASFALGKTRATTIRRVLLPSIRPSIASGMVLGMGRIIGDTAIVTVLLGAHAARTNPSAAPRSSEPCGAPARRSRATSSTTHRPARATRTKRPTRRRSCCCGGARAERRRHAPDARQANRDRAPGGTCSRAASRGVRMDPLMPPPIRRIVIDREPSDCRPGRRNGRRERSVRAAAARARSRRPPATPALVKERMRRRIGVARVRQQLGRARREHVRAPGRGAGADRRLGLGQDDAAALVEPAHRGHGGRRPQRADHARRQRHPRARGQRTAPPRDDGLPAAEPVPDEHLRQRRLRARRGRPPPRRRAQPAHGRARERRRRRATIAPVSTRRSPTTSIARRSRCRAASSSACASRGRSQPTRRCCCSTSRVRRSTRSRRRRSRS